MKFEKLKMFGNRALFSLKKHSPELLLAGAAVGTIAGTVMACKATLKLEATLDDIDAKLNDIRAKRDNGELTEKEYKNSITKGYIQGGMAMAKLYGPAVLVLGSSIAAAAGSHKIMRNRVTSLAAAYAAIDGEYRQYRRNIAEKYGEDADFEAKNNVIEETEKDEKGKDVKKKYLAGPQISDYAKFFDEACVEWTKDPEYNLTFLKMRQAEANTRLRLQGHLFLNEVYDMLGIPRTKAGNIVGWIWKDGIGDDFVSFGIYDNIDNPRSVDFVNGFERSILLDFNVQGPIIDSFAEKEQGVCY